MTLRSVIWQPQKKQVEFLQRSEYEVFYGGAAGGGKSMALLAEALRQVDIPHYRGLILRKTIPMLADLFDKSAQIYKKAFPAARYNDNKHCWSFPSGAKIYFGGLQHLKDRYKYQGLAFDFIGFDELTQFLFDEYIYMFSRNRPSGAGTECYIRATGNPGGIGHGWVKERFIIPAPAGQVIKEPVKIRFPDGRTETKVKRRIFIPSRVFDNQKLMENDPEYIDRLAMLPEAEREALLNGSWDSFSGQVFWEWRNDSERYYDRIMTHVIAPFDIPQHWHIYRGYDHGYSKPFSVGWYAVDLDGRIYRVRELYGCTGAPDVGVRWTVDKVADEIKRIENEDRNLKGHTIHGIADPAIWAGGDSIAESMAKRGIYFDKGDNARIAGKMQLHNRLAFSEDGRPMFYVFSTCRNFIRTVPSLVYSETDPEDVDTRQEDHIYDECRYVMMCEPISPPPKNTPRYQSFDPLGRDDELMQKYDKIYRL